MLFTILTRTHGNTAAWDTISRPFKNECAKLLYLNGTFSVSKLGGERNEAEAPKFHPFIQITINREHFPLLIRHRQRF
jgi:hypothetical protein